MSHKIFDNNLIAISKSKLTLKLNTGMCILELSYILMYEIITKDVYEDFSSDKEMFDFSNYPTNSKYYDNSNE